MLGQSSPVANRAGFAHIAFVVDDVEQALREIIAAGGSAFAEIVRTRVEGVGELTVTYARDPEGNLVEVQSWKTP